MSNKNTGGPAFPYEYFDKQINQVRVIAGMTLRDYFAAKAMLAEQPAQAQAPMANVWEMFAAYLIDKCEGEVITEEGLQRSLADMLADPKYTPQAQPAREWVGLTKDDMKTPDMGNYVFLNDDWIDGYKTGLEKADAKLKEKNT